MNIKNIFRGPVIWVILALLVLSTAMTRLFMPSVEQIDTSEGLSLINGGKVEQALMVDGDQRVDLTLLSDYEDKGDRVDFYYTEPHRPNIIDAIFDTVLRG